MEQTEYLYAIIHKPIFRILFSTNLEILLAQLETILRDSISTLKLSGNKFKSPSQVATWSRPLIRPQSDKSLIFFACQGKNLAQGKVKRKKKYMLVTTAPLNKQSHSVSELDNK